MQAINIYKIYNLKKSTNTDFIDSRSEIDLRVTHHKYYKNLAITYKSILCFPWHHLLVNT